jgi:hypothetical protein
VPSKYLKQREKFHENSVHLKYNPRNEMDRVMEEKTMHHKSASFEPCNPKILHHLRYREDNKDKWLGRPNFMSMTGNMDKGWDKTPFYLKSISDLYHQKYISVADFSR